MGEINKDNLETIGDYWSQRSEGFSEHVLEHMDEDINGLYIRKIHDFSNKTKMDVLDLGCGPGLFSIILGREGHNVTAVDYSDGMIDLALKNCADADVNGKILKMDAQNLEFEDESFDLIVSRKLVWNLEDPVKAYREWLRVLRPNGKMILFDGNYFLDMYDENYRKIKEEFMRKNFHEAPAEDGKPQLYQGADPNILTGFAKNLPLSRQRRPQWDVGTLLSLGAKSVSVEVNESVTSENAYGYTESLPQTFVITISKDNS